MTLLLVNVLSRAGLGGCHRQLHGDECRLRLRSGRAGAVHDTASRSAPSAI